MGSPSAPGGRWYEDGKSDQDEDEDDEEDGGKDHHDDEEGENEDNEAHLPSIKVMAAQSMTIRPLIDLLSAYIRLIVLHVRGHDC